MADGRDDVQMSAAQPFRPYIDRLRDDLAAIAADLDSLVAMSTIRYHSPRSGDMVIIRLSDLAWDPADDAITAAQMALIARYSAWFERFRLLFPNPTPAVRKKMERTDSFVRRWVERPSLFDNDLPRTIEEARGIAADRLKAFGELLGIAAHSGDAGLRLLPDTNVLLRNPAVEELGEAVGSSKHTVHIVTTVLAELDDLKDRGRTPDVREKAEKVVRRLKGFRDRGSLAQGVKVQGQVWLRLEHREVDARSILSWLDPASPDDRILAAALRLQSDNPAGIVVLITLDMNLQNKADVVGLPYAEPTRSAA
jgi:rRNA-processing protein FCF1